MFKISSVGPEPVFTSRINGDAFQGQMISPWYPADTAMELKVGGWINSNPDLHLYLEIDDNGAVRNKRYEGETPGHSNTNIWKIANLSSEGQRYRIVAKDLSSAPCGWFSVSLPKTAKSGMPYIIVTMSALGLAVCFFLSRRLFTKFLIVVVLAALFTFKGYYPGNQADVVRSDGVGYYAYLTMIFLDKDLSFKTRLEKNDHPKTHNHAFYYPETDKYSVVYTGGLAVLQLPFFGSACALSALIDSPLFPLTGYSYYFYCFVNLAGLFYLLAGLIIQYKLLRKFVDDFNATLISTVILFGTNLFSYAVADASLTHVYSFSLISLFILLTTHFYDTESRSRRWAISVAIGALLGIIAMVRTVNVIIVFFFLLYGVWRFSDLKTSLKTYFWHYLAAALASVAFFLPQMLYWRYTAGSFLINSYGDTGILFNWTSPFVKEVLFSINNGLLFWTPIWILAPLGLYFIGRYDKRWLYPLTAVLLIHLYITSSWSCWWYGCSFGKRPFVDVLAILAICLAAIIKFLKERRMIRTYHALMAAFLISGARNIILMFGFWFMTYRCDNAAPGEIMGTYALFFSNLARFIQNTGFLP
ncbi:hypothetical protein C4J81_19260 (plasmid) [Deltaproteobacteria bacterium Smac51]|nr:hypothetical protein C4J81_19260 [Deltaproteobacteria bacterium Smac51]